jgi:hypothetical protein
MTEVWLDIKNYEGQFQISSFGKVKRLEHIVIIKRNRDQKYHSKRKYSEKIMSSCNDQDGYLLVTLKSKMFKVHRLVAEHFIDNPLHLLQVGHKDGNYENNRYDNLFWKELITKQEKLENKKRYEKYYRTLPKRKAYENKRLGQKQYRNYVTSLKTRFNKAPAEARKRNLSWDIDFEYYCKILNKNCHYCNKTLLDETGSSLDRINNNLGYEINNVLPCCGNCNKIRGHRLTKEEMEVAMKAVLEFRSKNSDDKGLIQK